jgi:hypothetical protein
VQPPGPRGRRRDDRRRCPGRHGRRLRRRRHFPCGPG